MRPYRFLAVAVVLAACGDSTRPPEPTRIELSKPRVSLDAIGHADTIKVVVRDENGQEMPGAVVSWTGSAALSVTTLPGQPNVAEIKATAPGGGDVTIKVGKIDRVLGVDLVQAVASFTQSGDNQHGRVGMPLGSPLQVVALDRLGGRAAGIEVRFTASGSGSVNPATVTTGADGVAQTTWTLGTVAGIEHAVVVTAGSASTSFRATALAGDPQALTKLAGDSQSGWTNSRVDIVPAVRLTDAYQNPVAGVPVVFTASSGSVGNATAITNTNGIATPGSWTLGSSPGAMTLVASVPTAGLTTTFTATAAEGLAPVIIEVVAGDGQIGTEGQPLFDRPTVRLVNAGGTAQAGRTVVFEVVNGGGTVSGGTATTDASGVASVAWTMGAVSGPNALRVRVTDGAAENNGFTFTATGCTGGPGDYVINVCFLTPMTPAQRNAFVTASAKWSSVITGDVPDVAMNLSSANCGGSTPPVRGRIDDLVIFARVEPIDGPGQILGSAGPCYVRLNGTQWTFPIIGTMRFDAADMATLESNGRLTDVIIHEMGHVIGIGTLWSANGFLQNPSAVGGPQDTYFNGTGALAGFDQIGGLTYTGGAKVPVENGQGNSLGTGSINSHWRESVLGNELMTPQINSGVNPLTILSVLSLRDIGYVVNPAAADSHLMSDVLADRRAGAVFNLENDVYTGPVYGTDQQGRTRRLR